MADFNIVARLQVQGPSGAELSGISRQIERGISGRKIDISLGGNAQAQVTQISRQFATLNQTLAATTAGVNAATSGMSRFSGQIGVAARRFAAFTVAAGALVKVSQGIRQGISEAIAFEREMVRLGQVSESSAAQIRSIQQEIGQLSTSLGASSKELAQAAVVFKQAGFSFEATAKSLETLALSALAPNFDSMSETAEGMIAVMRQFNIGAKETQAAIGSLNAVAGAFAVEAADLIAVVQKAGGAFNQTGGSLNELLGLFTSVRSTTRESADAIATGLRTIFTRLQRSETVDALKALNINLRHTREEASAVGNLALENQFVGAYEAVRRLSEGLATLRTTDPRYAQIVEQLGGFRQVSRVIPLIKQFSEAQRAVNVAQSGQTSLVSAAEKAQESLSVRIDKTQEKFLALFRTITESKAFQSLADTLLNVSNLLADILDGTSAITSAFGGIKPFLPVLTGLGVGATTRFLTQNIGAIGSGVRGRRFNRGGFVVPGVGNSDTVPMDLEEGSFVLRKQASEKLRRVPSLLTPGERVFSPEEVKKIGLSNLRRLNEKRFASGGFVQRFASGGTPRKSLRERLLERAEKVEKSTITSFSTENLEGGSKPALSPAGKSEELIVPLSTLREIPEIFQEAVAKAQEMGLQVGKSLDVILDVFETGERVFRGVREGVREVASTEPTPAEQRRRVRNPRLIRQEDERSVRQPQVVPKSAPIQITSLDQKVSKDIAQRLIEQNADLLTNLLGGKAGSIGILQAKGRLGSTRGEQFDEGELFHQGFLRLRSTALNFNPAKAGLTEEDLQDPAKVTARFRAVATQNIRQGILKSAGEQAKKQQGFIAEAERADSGVSQKQDRIRGIFSLNASSEDERGVAAQFADPKAEDPFAAFSRFEDPSVLNAIVDKLTSRKDRKPTKGALEARDNLLAIDNPDLISRLREELKLTGEGNEGKALNRLADLGVSLSPETFVDEKGRGSAAPLREIIASLEALPEAIRGKVAQQGTLKELSETGGFLGRQISSPAEINAILGGVKDDSLIAQLEQAGVRADKGVANTSQLQGVLDIVRKIPEEFRTRLVESGAFANLSPGEVTEARIFSQNISTSKPRPGVAGTSGTFRDEAGNVTNQSILSRRGLEADIERLQTGGRSTLLHEQSHLLDKILGGSERISSQSRFQPVHEQLQKFFLSDKQFADKDPNYLADRLKEATETFAEGFARFFQGGEAQSALPQEAQSFFQSLVDEVRVSKTEDVKVPQATPPAQPETITSPAVVETQVSKTQRRSKRKEEREAKQREVAGQAFFQILSGGTQPNHFNDPAFKPSGPLAQHLPSARPVRDRARFQAQPLDLSAGARAIALLSLAEQQEADAQKIRQERAERQRVTDPLALKQSGSNLPPGNRPPSGTTSPGNPPQTPGGNPPIVPPTGNLLAPPSPEDPRRNNGVQGRFQTNTIRFVTQGQTEKDILSQGGRDVLSATTQGEIAAGAQAKIQQELVAAQARLLQQIHPQIKASEALRKAEEQVAAAWQTNQKVVRDLNGRVLGLQNTVIQSQRQAFSQGNVWAPDFGPAPGRLASARQGIANTARGIAESRFGRGVNRIGSGLSSFPALLAGPLAAGLLDTSAGTAEQAVKSNGEGSFRNLRATSGGIQGALAGAGVGAAAGPFGAVIGAVIGAGTGIASALKDSEKQIRDIKIHEALAKFSSALATVDFSSGKTNASVLRDQIRNINRESREANLSESGGFFRAIGSAFGISDRFDTKKFAELQARSERDNFSDQVPDIAVFLSKQAEEIAKSNVGASVQDLTNQLRDGGDGLNRELLGIVARIRGVSVEEALKDFGKTIEATQRQLRIEQASRESSDAQQRVSADLSRLSISLQAAADGLRSLQERSVALADSFQGIVSASLVDLGASRVGGLTTGRGDALDAFGTLRGTDRGNRLFDSAKAVSEVGSVLSSAITDAIARGPSDEQVLTSRIRGNVAASLGERADSEEIQRVLNSLISTISEQTKDDPTSFIRQAGVDVTGLSQSLLADQARPLQEIAEQSLSVLQNQANDFIQGLTARSQQRGILQQERGALDNLQVERLRTQAEFDARRAGRPGQGLDALSAAQLQLPFRLAQQRLTGLQGGRAFDPSAIGQALAANRNRALQLQDRQQELASTPGGLQSDEFRQVAEELTNVKSRAADLQQALRNLADVSSRNAVIQEKLSRIDNDRASRRGLAERLITGSFEDRNNLNRGLGLAKSLAESGGDLRGLSERDRGLVVEALRAAGGATLSGIKGAPTGENLLNQFLDKSVPGLALPAETLKEEEQLRKEQLENVKLAAKAQEELIKRQEQASDKFFDNLNKGFQDFFKSFQSQQIRSDIGNLENRRASLGTRQSELATLSQQRDILAQAGVTNDAGVTRLSGARDALSRFFEARQKINDVTARGNALKGQSGDILAGAFGSTSRSILPAEVRTNLVEQLRQRGVANADAVTEDFRNRRQRRFSELVRGEGAGRAKELIQSELPRLLESSIDANTRTLEGKLVDSDLSPAFKTLEQKGINPGQISAISNSQVPQLFAALEAFDGTKNTLSGLDTEIANTKQEFVTLTTQIADLNNKLKGLEDSRVAQGEVQKFAGGGSVFQPRGTDTVPAMLTPKEFVVNAASAQANLPLLKKINAAKGPVYLQFGGLTEEVLRNSFGGKSTNHVSPEEFIAQQQAKAAALKPTPEEPGLDTTGTFAMLRRLAQANPRGRSARLIAQINAFQRAQKRLQSRGFVKDPNKINELALRAARRAGRGFTAGANIANFQYAQAFSQGPSNLVFGRPGIDAGQSSLFASGFRSRFLTNDPTQNSPNNSEARKIQIGAFRGFGALGFANGGQVPGAGTTDSQLAAVTPGEFVFSRDAVARAGIHNLQRFNRGGLVGGAQYFAEGGSVSPSTSSPGEMSLSSESTQALENFSNSISNLNGGLNTFSASAENLVSAMNTFASNSDTLAKALQNMPKEITLSGQQQLTVVFNGHEVLQTLQPELQRLVTDATKTQLQKIFKNQLPDANVNLD